MQHLEVVLRQIRNRLWVLKQEIYTGVDIVYYYFNSSLLITILYFTCAILRTKVTSKLTIQAEIYSNDQSKVTSKLTIQAEMYSNDQSKVTSKLTIQAEMYSNDESKVTSKLMIQAEMYSNYQYTHL